MAESKLLTLKEASEWVSQRFKRNVTSSNISYLVQYGQIQKVNGNGSGEFKVNQEDLLKYYSAQGQKETDWKRQLGENLDWHLSFDRVKESERTKHVHRLHPYKGKFIPQLVEYFLDNHTDEFKDRLYFRADDIVLDPFCGSGTTLVQANELGMHAIGIDVSEFNALITNTKVHKHNLYDLHNEIRKITIALKNFVAQNTWYKFEEELVEQLAEFNQANFPSPDYVYKVRSGKIDYVNYSKEKEKKFLPIFSQLVKKHRIQITQDNQNDSFLGKWYLNTVRREINLVKQLVDRVQNSDTKEVISIILSRTMRSSRATTHADLATLIDPVTTTYYCHKHYKICKPLFSIVNWWEYYSKDTIKRLSDFDRIRTNTQQLCLVGDSRSLDIFQALKHNDPKLAAIASRRKIKGIFSSPPYVGLIDYHEQHAYAYELFGLPRRDDSEIGPLYKGRGSDARTFYISGISEVLLNCKKYLSDDYDVLLVANDSHNLYPEIAKKSGMRIIKEFRRPVLNRTEKDKSAYSEKIFHLKEA